MLDRDFSPSVTLRQLALREFYGKKLELNACSYHVPCTKPEKVSKKRGTPNAIKPPRYDERAIGTSVVIIHMRSLSYLMPLFPPLFGGF